MARFLIFYFVVYGGAHFYFLVKLKNAFKLSTQTKTFTTAITITLFLAPLIARKLESSGLDLLPELLSNSGYLWMGFLFLFISSAALIDCVNLALTRARRKVPARHLFMAAAAYSLLIGCYGYYEAKHVAPEYLTIKSDRIPRVVGKIRVVLLSDVHIGQVVREQRIRAILATIKAASPDIIISTGDLLDGHQRHFSGLERLFLELKPRLGKYAVPGNHEYYVGIEDSLKFMRAAGFKVLINETFELGNAISITGVDDSHTKLERSKNALVEKRLLDSAAAGGFILLLKHRPIVEKTSLGNFDLQLSGHVHKGQIFPFNMLTWISFPVNTGLTVLADRSSLYVSRGTGTWGPPIRFLAPPEITVIDLLPEAGTTKKN